MLLVYPVPCIRIFGWRESDWSGQTANVLTEPPSTYPNKNLDYFHIFWNLKRVPRIRHTHYVTKPRTHKVSFCCCFGFGSVLCVPVRLCIRLRRGWRYFFLLLFFPEFTFFSTALLVKLVLFVYILLRSVARLFAVRGIKKHLAHFWAEFEFLFTMFCRVWCNGLHTLWRNFDSTLSPEWERERGKGKEGDMDTLYVWLRHMTKTATRMLRTRIDRIVKRKVKQIQGFMHEARFFWSARMVTEPKRTMSIAGGSQPANCCNGRAASNNCIHCGHKLRTTIIHLAVVHSDFTSSAAAHLHATWCR